MTLAVFLLLFTILSTTRGIRFASRRGGSLRRPVLAAGCCRMSSSAVHAPSQFVVDEEKGEKWRLCAGAAVLNSRNELLVGKRVGAVPEAWQCPQGGVDDAWTPPGETSERPKETVLEACNRELYEEMGLKVGKHVIVDDTFPTDDFAAVRYRTSGTSNWLTAAGYAGQELHWACYRIIDARGDLDPCLTCDLSGNGGEHAEFSAVKWQPVDQVVANIWEKKLQPYEALQRLLEQHAWKWQERIKSLDFSGGWERDHSQSVGVVEGLVRRGLTPEEAMRTAKKPHRQSWTRCSSDSTSWHVITYCEDGKTPRRELIYRVGEWEEQYEGESTLFGTSQEHSTILHRRICYVAEPDADEPIRIAHVTVTTSPLGGVEEARRYLRGDKFLLRRTLWTNEEPDNPIVSTEVFVRPG